MTSWWCQSSRQPGGGEQRIKNELKIWWWWWWLDMGKHRINSVFDLLWMSNPMQGYKRGVGVTLHIGSEQNRIWRIHCCSMARTSLCIATAGQCIAFMPKANLSKQGTRWQIMRCLGIKLWRIFSTVQCIVFCSLQYLYWETMLHTTSAES